jgi:hypothetical protein
MARKSDKAENIQEVGVALAVTPLSVAEEL